MKLNLWIVPVVCMFLLLVSATPTNVGKVPVAAEKEAVETSAQAAASVQKTNKFTFFQRVMLKYAAKKYYKAEDTGRADKQATIGLALGITACVLLATVLLALPYVFLASIPAAILAMILGNSALRGNTTKVGHARTARGLGLGALIALGVLLIVAAIAISTWTW